MKAKSQIISLILVISMVLVLFAACAAPAQDTTAEAATEADEATDTQAATDVEAEVSDELYILVSPLTSFPMYVNHDQEAFTRWGEEMGVQTQIIGPSDYDIPGTVSVLEQAMAMNPAGILTIGADPTMETVINKIVDAGIPVITYDGDIPTSKRLCFVGTNWEEIGRLEGEAMAELLGGKGKVAYMGMVGLVNMEKAFAAFEEVLSEYPDIEIVGKYDDGASVEKAASLTADILSAHPDIAGVAGFDAMSGPGIGLAIKEAGKAGEIKVTTVDIEPEHLALVEEGVIDTLIGQKRELFTYYAAQLLYDYVHEANSLSSDDVAAGITSIPALVDTGLVIVTKENVDKFID